MRGTLRNERAIGTRMRTARASPPARDPRYWDEGAGRGADMGLFGSVELVYCLLAYARL